MMDAPASMEEKNLRWQQMRLREEALSALQKAHAASPAPFPSYEGISDEEAQQIETVGQAVKFIEQNR